MNTRRLASCLVALALPATALLAQAAPAQAAGTPGCITKPEYKKLKKNTPQKRVQKIVGARGKVDSQSSFNDGDGFKTLSFRQCGSSYGGVTVSLEKTEKEVYKPDVQCFDFDGDGYEETCEDFGYTETVYKNPMILTSKYAYWS